MEGARQSSQQQQLCRNGCGFYGSAKTDGMCSLCYKETVQKKNNNGRKSPAVTPTAAKPDPIVSCSTEPPTTNNSNVASAMASLATNDSPQKSVPPAASSPTASATSTASTTSSSPISIPSATTTLTSFSPQQGSAGNMDELVSTSVDEDSSSSSPSKPKKSRCATCRKRVGLTGFYCRCGKLFCSLHRYSDQHECDFDYKADAQAKIRKENPVVVGEKINKI